MVDGIDKSTVDAKLLLEQDVLTDYYACEKGPLRPTAYPCTAMRQAAKVVLFKSAALRRRVRGREPRGRLEHGAHRVPPRSPGDDTALSGVRAKAACRTTLTTLFCTAWGCSLGCALRLGPGARGCAACLSTPVPRAAPQLGQAVRAVLRGRHDAGRGFETRGPPGSDCLVGRALAKR